MATVLNSYLFAGAPPSGVSLVGTSYATGIGSGSIAYPSGSMAGDIGVFLFIGNGGVSISGWTGGSSGLGTGSGKSMSHGRKVLDSSDLTGGVLSSWTQNGDCILAVYRGGTGVSVKTTSQVPQDGDTGEPIAATSFTTSFTKAVGSLKLVDLFITQSTTGTFTAPWNVQASSSAYCVDDLAPASYTNGASITSSWVNSVTLVCSAKFEIT